jgi:hypothetical protein
MELYLPSHSPYGVVFSHRESSTFIFDYNSQLLGKMWKKVDVICSKFLPKYLSEGIQKNYKNISQCSSSQGRGLNVGLRMLTCNSDFLGDQSCDNGVSI